MLNRFSPILALFLVLSLAAAGRATLIDDPSNGEDNLYEIWNSILGDNQTSSQELYDQYGVADPYDEYWIGGPGTIEVTVRYASYTQSLGYRDSTGDDHIIIPYIRKGETNVSRTFTPDGDFVWLDNIKFIYLDNDKWYSADGMNSDGLDHFVAMQVPTEFYGALYPTSYTIDTGIPIYMIAFEDGSDLGDRDYNDLVAFVTGVHNVPLPGAVFLLGTGLIGVAGIRRMFKRG